MRSDVVLRPEVAGRVLRSPVWPGAEPPLAEAAAWACQDGRRDVEDMSMAFIQPYFAPAASIV